MGTSTARGSTAQEFLIVVQLVVPRIKGLLEFLGSGSKTRQPKRRGHLGLLTCTESVLRYLSNR